jgi:hypothetical protein
VKVLDLPDDQRGDLAAAVFEDTQAALTEELGRNAEVHEVAEILAVALGISTGLMTAMGYGAEHGEFLTKLAAEESERTFTQFVKGTAEGEA